MIHVHGSEQKTWSYYNLTGGSSARITLQGYRQEYRRRMNATCYPMRRQLLKLSFKLLVKQQRTFHGVIDYGKTKASTIE